MASKLSLDTSYKPLLSDSSSPLVQSPIRLPGQHNVRVIARFRPFIELEGEVQDESKQMTFVDDRQVSFYEGFHGVQTFRFDKVFTPSSTQIEIFECVGMPIWQDVVAGYNGTVLAYGQTGSGKTHSMMGADLYEYGTRGIIPRWAAFLFDYVNEQDSNSEFTIKISMIEIYKENILDLLNHEEENLYIKEDANRGIYIKDLTEYSVVCESELLEIISLGESVRTVAATKLNQYSSRSHQLVMIEVLQKLENGSEKRGKLNLVDLAGSEKIAHSGVTGKNLEEAKKINLSLSCLGNVIYALVKKKDYIPYRDSKLTRLLQESLGGNYKTTLIVACSPHPNNHDDTINTLRFGQRAKTIKNKAKVNLLRSPAEYMRMIAKLKAELESVTFELNTLKCYSTNDLSNDIAVNDESLQQDIARLNSLNEEGDKANDESLKHDFSRFNRMSENSNAAPLEIVDFTIDLTAADADTDLITSTEYSTPSPQHAETVSKKAYIQIKGAVKRLTMEKTDLNDKISDLNEKLKKSQEHSVKQTEKVNEYAEKYRLLQKNGTNAVQSAIMNNEIKTLRQTVSKLKLALRTNDFKYKNLLQKATDVGLQTSDLEFEQMYLDQVLETGEINEDVQETSIDLNYVDLTVDPDTIFEVNPYSQKIREKMGTDDTEMSRQLEIFHLKNQLYQAQLFNYNIARCMSYLECELFLARTRNSMLEKQTIQQANEIESLEKMLDTLHDAFKHNQKHTHTASYSIQGFESQPEVRYLDSALDALSPKDVNLQLDFDRPTPNRGSAYSSHSHHKFGSGETGHLVVVHENEESEQFTEFSPAFRKSRSISQNFPHSGDKTQLPEIRVSYLDLPDTSPEFEKTPPANRVRLARPITGRGRLAQRSMYNFDSITGTLVLTSPKARQSYHSSIDTNNTPLYAYPTTQQLKKLEVQLNTQRLYNQHLVKQNKMVKQEKEILQGTISGLETRNKSYHVWHFEHWSELFNQYKQNCDFELKRKQAEINHLHEVLYQWVKEYMSLSQIGEDNFEGADINGIFFDRLFKLWASTKVNPISKPEVRFNQAFAPRSSSMPCKGRGDSSPIESDDDDFF